MGKKRTANGAATALMLLTAMVLQACGGGSQTHADGSNGAPAGGGNGAGGMGGGDGGAGSGGALPLTGVYRMGATAPSCGADALERFWPTRATVYYSGFDCSTNYFVFRPTDGQLFYHSIAEGILVDGAGSMDDAVPTPPCTTSVEGAFGFDGQGRLYYRCSIRLMRGNGELLATDVNELAGVLADGRTIVYREVMNPPALQFEVLAPDGANVNVLRPEADLGASAYPVPRATTVVGNDGYVLLARLHDPDPPELVVYHLDAQSRWSLVRRLVGVTRQRYELVTADGTIFILEQAEPQTSDLHVVAYEPDRSTPREVWREGQSPTVHAGSQLLLGPLDAFGPSVKTE